MAAISKASREEPRRWAYFDPEQEARWAAEIYPALLREMALRPEWAKAIIEARRKRLGEAAAERLRQHAAAVYLRMKAEGRPSSGP